MLARRKYLIGSGAGLAAAALAAACGPAGGGAGEGAPAASQGPVKLVLLHAWDEARLPLMEKMRDEFQQRNPRITVDFDLTTTASGMASPRVQKLVTAVAGGAPPDVTMLWRGSSPRWRCRACCSRSTSRSAATGSIPRSTTRRSGRPRATRTRPTCCPTSPPAARYLVHYNRDHLKEGGYQPDQAPATWGQAGDALKKLTKSEGGRITRLGGARAGGVGGFILYTLNNKGKYLAEDGRKVQFDSPETVEALEWMQNFWEPVGGAAAIAAFSQTYPTTAAQSPFTTGNQTFTVTNPSQIFHIRANNPGLDFGVALPPSRAQGFRGQELHPRGLELRHPRRGQAGLEFLAPGALALGHQRGGRLVHAAAIAPLADEGSQRGPLLRGEAAHGVAPAAQGDGEGRRRAHHPGGR